MASPSKPQCVLDRNVLNKNTVGELTDMGLSLFAPLCGKNRGAFIVDPPDGHTYGCLQIPPQWADEVGTDVTIKDSNAIKDQFMAKNITARQTVDLLDLLTVSVYESSANVDKDVYACDAGGLAALKCPDQHSPLPKIRAVTLAGLFTPFLGETMTLDEADAFYTTDDFDDMRSLGLTAIQIPLPLDAFEHPAIASVVEGIMEMASGAGLDVILTLKAIEDLSHIDRAVTAAAAFCVNHIVLGLTLPHSSMIAAARAEAPTLPLFVTINAGQLQDLSFDDDPNIFASLDMDHSTTVADVASSDSLNDRMKLFYHEAIACIQRSPLEYVKCYRGVPTFVSGFDLSIDDCVKKDNPDFKDYGQCDRFDETIGSGWWKAHRSSFAARQVFAYEQGMGWSFGNWKLSTDDVDDVIHDPTELLALKNVVAAGLFPALEVKVPAAKACLNPPLTDFVLGDMTLSPSPGPPPDCGNGWWNYDLEACEYWIPPSAAPATDMPSVGCPSCPACPLPTYTAADMKHATINGGVLGSAAGLIVGVIVMKIFGKKNEGYTTIPN